MNQYTVLIIHNDEIMQKLMEHTTGTENYRFCQAGNGLGGGAVAFLCRASGYGAA